MLFPALWLSFPICQPELQAFGVGSFLCDPKRSVSHWWEGTGEKTISKCPLYSYVPGMWHVTWHALLQLCEDHEIMRDECYCQVVKQITGNTSTKQ